MGTWLGRLLGRQTKQPPAGLRTAYCSFCRRSHRDVGPLAEGPDLVFICGGCAAACSRLIEDEQARLAGAASGGKGHALPGGDDNDA
jgi:ATP-dependent Clp protease ATP-binding subunit ClpX